MMGFIKAWAPPAGPTEGGWGVGGGAVTVPAAPTGPAFSLQALGSTTVVRSTNSLGNYLYSVKSLRILHCFYWLHLQVTNELFSQMYEQDIRHCEAKKNHIQ